MIPPAHAGVLTSLRSRKVFIEQITHEDLKYLERLYGNSVLLVANGTRVLVDAGLSAPGTVRRMAMLAKTRTPLMAF